MTAVPSLLLAATESREGVISLDAATVLLQWSVGGLLFTWVTTRHREVGLGYGWLQRGVFAVFAGIAVFAGVRYGGSSLRTVAAAAVVVITLAVLAVSVARKDAGVAGQQAEHDRRSARVAAMTGIDRAGPAAGDDVGPVGAGAGTRREFDPRLDLLAPIVGTVGLVGAGWASAAATPDRLLAVARVLVGAAFLGAVTDAMLLGHWYLVQPGLPRRLLHELVRWLGYVWPFEVALLLVPTGMVSVINGTIDDGYNGMLGWFWIACAVTTIGLVVVTRAALRERAYSAVMAATGLLYLAILTAFGTDLVARAVLAG